MIDINSWLWRCLRNARYFFFIIQNLGLYHNSFHVAVPGKAKGVDSLTCGNNISVSVHSSVFYYIFLTGLRCIESTRKTWHLEKCCGSWHGVWQCRSLDAKAALSSWFSDKPRWFAVLSFDTFYHCNEKVIVDPIHLFCCVR